LADRVPVELRISMNHPVRDRLHLLVDRLDPEALEPFTTILERYAAALDACSGPPEGDCGDESA
jgi:hypothetical protein